MNQKQLLQLLRDDGWVLRRENDLLFELDFPVRPEELMAIA